MLLSDNLEKLINRFPNSASISSAKHQLAARYSERMPLTNAVGTGPLLKILNSQAIVPQASLPKTDNSEPGRRKPTTETTLGTDHFVFFFAGPFSYPNTEAGFLFQSTLGEMDAEKEATPFDSGGLIQYLKPSLSHEERMLFFNQHKLPVPGYRGYLKKFLQHCFQTPWDYINGLEPDPYFIDLESHADRRSWTIEVRIASSIDLEAHLKAVFLPDRLIKSLDTVLDFADQCEARGVEVIRTKKDINGTYYALIKACEVYLSKIL